MSNAPNKQDLYATIARKENGEKPATNHAQITVRPIANCHQENASQITMSIMRIQRNCVSFFYIKLSIRVVNIS